MAQVSYISHAGQETILDLDPGTNIMRGALSNGVASIYTECGGQTMCATCHVYVDESNLNDFPAVDEDEDEMLEATACDRLDNSRLSCGLVITDEHDQIVVRMPETQR
ncbi:(2Fe-2S)-binding protein [Rhodococcus sp. KBS0724]|uniref:2Fe-2S iron-sulfur cluster-binding protein n=1 Tax=Rhodococcus sp. KBS0724 TaxID=1179674 RepID=UPI00110D6C5E|nr:2Fe-2S iron-sulfur cluster-binding protein [Rhodococcus sp. KBS0724]TSD40248.1 (2Fe-2S)-binding protein [Rhodococcus sp. KBS0724]